MKNYEEYVSMEFFALGRKHIMRFVKDEGGKLMILKPSKIKCLKKRKYERKEKISALSEQGSGEEGSHFEG